jgi:hypothetical protein
MNKSDITALNMQNKVIKFMRYLWRFTRFMKQGSCLHWHVTLHNIQEWLNTLISRIQNNSLKCYGTLNPVQIYFSNWVRKVGGAYKWCRTLKVITSEINFNSASFTSF